VHQKTVLYLGELNDSQQAVWAKAIEVFNTDSGQTETRSLFPSDRPAPLTDAPALSLHLQDYGLSRPRQYGACWLASDLWRQLGLDQFWADKLPPSREGTDWARLLQVSTAYRLIAPGSEWRCHRQWYDRRPWAICSVRIFIGVVKTSFTSCWTACWNIVQPYLPICRLDGRTSSPPNTKCCSRT